MKVTQDAVAASERTIQSYESFAAQYATLVSPQPPHPVGAALRKLAEQLPRPAVVLEVGSGPGRDADYLESLGLVVRRTDATQAFLDMQKARGKTGARLNVLTDDLGGPYDAVLANCVLIHIDREHTPGVLQKIAGALLPGGCFLSSVRIGTGETRGAYHMTYWRRPGFTEYLSKAGLRATWTNRHVDSGGDAWLTVLARRYR